MEDAFLKGDKYGNEDCCLDLRELDYIIEGLGGLRQIVFPDQPSYEPVERENIPITSVSQQTGASANFSAASIADVATYRR